MTHSPAAKTPLSRFLAFHIADGRDDDDRVVFYRSLSASLANKRSHRLAVI
ncbi:hypothetical protein ANO14919_005410 [Xylariales sp. No.14919]|nr:hypothetical protein ANO14919_005410 [Xylariales sp. No.14919]